MAKKCISPILIYDKVQRKNRPRPCGYCSSCRNGKVLGWVFRLIEEMRSSNTAAFFTFTYKDSELPWTDYGPSLYKRDFQTYMKRLRKAQAKVSNDKIRYYACGEYGGKTGRPHYHAVLFNVHEALHLPVLMESIWQKGQVDSAPLNMARIKYVCKYVMKNHNKTELQNEFSLMSKRLGKSWLTPANVQFYKDRELPYVHDEFGSKWPMSRYFKERIHDKEVRDRLGQEAIASLEYKPLDSTIMERIKRDNHYKQLNLNRNDKI